VTARNKSVEVFEDPSQ